jgi:hypothetical protein
MAYLLNSGVFTLMVNRVSFTMLLNYSVLKSTACNMANVNNHKLETIF